MEEKYELSDVEFEEIENVSIQIDGTTYCLARVLKFPEDRSMESFIYTNKVCDICSLGEKCRYTPTIGICSMLSDLAGMENKEKGKLFLN